ncbi:MAG TPA: tripartite tricarboxylate transporter TctB family protein [Candidatus Acidoferrales bacterium]|nr:tripartite tricarboxylate transporter TctB family protein [Candidatus Acidoferrales bacterium]
MRANLTLFFLLVFVVAAVSGWEWPYIAKLMPVYVAAIPGIVLCLVQLFREATAWEERKGTQGGVEMDEVYQAKLEKRIETRRTLIFFAWFIGGALGIWLFGIVIAIPALVFLYMLFEGKEKWSTSLIMTVSAYLLIWGLFEYMLEARWPPGLLFR